LGTDGRTSAAFRLLRAAVIAATVCVVCPAAALATGPTVDDVNVLNAYDIHAEVQADIETGGQPTQWQIKYATADSFNQSGQYDQQTPLMDVPTGSGPQSVSDVLTGLVPGTPYDIEVDAVTGSGPPATFPTTMATTPQFTGTAGSPTDFSTTAVRPCPGTPISVDWGDGTTSASVPMTCNGDTNSGTLDTTHTYAAPGHYDVTDTSGPTPLAGAQIAAATTTTTTTTATTAPPPPPPPPTNVDRLFGTVSLATASMPQTDAPSATPDAKARVTVILKSAKGTVTQSTVTDSQGNFEFPALPSCIPGGAVTCTVEVLGAKGVVDDQTSVTLPDRISNTRADLVAGRLSERDWVSGVVLAPSDAAGAGGTGSPSGWNLSTVGPSIRAAAGLRPVPHAASSVPVGSPTTDITVSQVDGSGKSKQIYDALKTCRQDRWGEVAPGLGVPSHKTDCTSTIGPFLLEGVPLTQPNNSARGETPHFVITLLERNAAGKYVAVDSAQLKLPTGPKAKDGARPLIIAPALNSVVPVPDQPGERTVSGQVTHLRPFLPRASAVDPPPVANAEVKLTVSAPGFGTSNSATTRTDRNGYYAFSTVPKCSGREKCQYSVAVLTGKIVEDSQTFPTPTTVPSVTVADLTGNLTSDGLFVRGNVVAPDGSGSLPDTALTIGPRGKGGTVLAPLFDSRTDCRPKDWGPPSGGPSGRPCTSTVGSYLLSGVDRTAIGKPDTTVKDMVITLLERNSAGKFVAIDSAPITLPTQMGAHPVINAPTLTAVAPVPTTTNGRTVSGTVTTFKPFLPGAPSAQPADAGAQVTVTIKTPGKAGSGNVNRTVKADSKGRYSVTGLPACHPKAGATAGGTCTVSVGSAKAHDVEDFTLSELSPTTAQVDLQAGLEANSPVLTGMVKAPLTPGKGGPLHTDIQITTAKGQVLYDALNACAKGGWSLAGGPSHPGPCVGGFGDYALGSIPTLTPSLSTAQVIATLLEENAAGRFTPVDSVKIKLPHKPGPGASPEVVSAPTLHG
jgi:hypothetical protein